MTEYISGHYIECQRLAKFAKNPDINQRKTKLFLLDKKFNKWSREKITVDHLFKDTKSILKTLEDEFTKCEIAFNDFLACQKYKVNSISVKDAPIVATYISMNVCRNPISLTGALYRTHHDHKNKILRNLADDLG